MSNIRDDRANLSVAQIISFFKITWPRLLRNCIIFGNVAETGYMVFSAID